MARPNDSAVVLYLRVKRSEKREVGQASGGASAARSEAEIVSEMMPETSRTASMILRTASWDDSPQGPPPSSSSAPSAPASPALPSPSEGRRQWTAAVPRTDVEAYCRSLRAGQTARADPAYVRSPFFPAAFIEFQIWPALRRVLSNELPKTRSLAALRWLVSFGSDLALPSPELTRARRPLELIYANYSTDLQTLKSVVEGIQDVCRDAAARWALATADTATLRRRLLVPALRESRGIADHPLWAHTSEPLRPDLEELNERVEHALELGYSLTGALRRFSLLFPLRYSTTAESLGLATRRFLVSGETLSEDISRLTGAAWRLCSRPLLYDAETGRVQIPLATEEEEEAVVAVKEKSVSSSPRHYSTDRLHPRTQAASAGGSRHPTSPQHGRHHVSRQEHLQGPGGRPRPSSCRARDHPY